jgi:hypothetical protein
MAIAPAFPGNFRGRSRIEEEEEDGIHRARGFEKGDSALKSVRLLKPYV